MYYVHKFIFFYISQIYVYSYTIYTLNCAFLSYLITFNSPKSLDPLWGKVCIFEIDTPGRIWQFTHLFTHKNKSFLYHQYCVLCLNLHIYSLEYISDFAFPA